MATFKYLLSDIPFLILQLENMKGWKPPDTGSMQEKEANEVLK